jgi:hypothetical protein
MTDKRAKLRTLWGIDPKSKQDLVMLVISLLSLFETDKGLLHKKVYSANSIRMLKSVGYALDLLHLGGEFRIVPSSPGRAAEPRFVLNDSVVQTPGEYSWITVLRIAEASLAAVSRPVECDFPVSPTMEGITSHPEPVYTGTDPNTIVLAGDKDIPEESWLGQESHLSGDVSETSPGEELIIVDGKDHIKLETQLDRDAGPTDLRPDSMESVLMFDPSDIALSVPLVEQTPLVSPNERFFANYRRDLLPDYEGSRLIYFIKGKCDLISPAARPEWYIPQRISRVKGFRSLPLIRRFQNRIKNGWGPFVDNETFLIVGKAHVRALFLLYLLV